MGKAKDTFYFSHDFGARNDPKLLSLMVSHGVAGIGIFWCIIEQLYEQGGILPLSACKSIAFALHVDEEVVDDVVMNHDLFVNDGDSFWSESVNARLERRKDIAEKRKAAAEKRWKSERKRKATSKSNASASKKDANAMLCNAIKGKERKGKEIKDINIESNKLDSSEKKFSDVDDKTKKIDFNKIVDMYHQNCPSFPKIIKMSDARKQKIRIRLEEMKYDYSLLEKVFKKMQNSKFLRGDNKNGWSASFDWVFQNSKNWVKIAEGNYDDKGSSSKNVNDIWK